MSESFSLYITVNKSKKIINGLHRYITVQEVINQLLQSCSLRRPQILVEVWKNCTRPLHPEEKLCESFSKWGSESRNVTLKLVDVKEFGLISTYKKRKRKRQRIFGLFNDSRFTRSSKTITGAQRIFMRKYPVALASKKSKKNSVKRLQIRLRRFLEEFDCEIYDLRCELNELDEQEEEIMEIISGKRNDQEIVSSLHPQLQAEYVYLKKGVIKHRNSIKELEKHKKELEQSISNRQSEILSLETNVETTQAKIDAEKRALDIKPLDITETQECKLLKQKLEDLQNHLRAKQKISQLQAMKMQELASQKENYEKSLKDFQKQMSSLKQEVYKNNEEEAMDFV